MVSAGLGEEPKSQTCVRKTLRKHTWDFPGGPMVKNPPANAGDTGSVPDQGRFHMLQSNSACAPQLLSPSAAAREAAAMRSLSSASGG